MKSLLAHQVQVAEEVGATLHIEPNDTPRAGETVLAWFALTRRGGQTIPLSECNCRLTVDAQPAQPDQNPLLQPVLKPISAEGYAAIPGADLTFPQVGTYQLVLQGTPKQEGTFQPFELTYNVTVAAGTTAPSPSVQTAFPSQPSAIAPSPQSEVPGQPILIGVGIALAVIAVGAIAIRLIFAHQSQ